MPANSSSIATTGSNEYFYRGSAGKKQDAALHEALLDDPAADETAAQWDVAAAVKDGMSLPEALRAYGTDRMLTESRLPLRG